jgi:hypothetical protein
MKHTDATAGGTCSNRWTLMGNKERQMGRNERIDK